MTKRKPKESMRRCAGCGKSFAQSSLIRIKRDKDGLPVMGALGDIPGRSAYVCDAMCMERALKKRGFERAFRASLSKDFYDAIPKEFLSNEP